MKTANRLQSLSPEARELAAALLREQGLKIEPDTLPRFDPDSGPPPLSFTQERLLFVDQLAGISSAYAIPKLLHLEGPLSLEALEAAYHNLLDRHRVFRTGVRVQSGTPVQFFCEPPWPRLEILDRSDLASESKAPELRTLINELCSLPLPLDEPPLLRALLICQGVESHTLILTTHHYAVDGWAVRILLEDLMAYYVANLRAEPAAVAPLPVEYADYALWQRGHEFHPDVQNNLEYWAERLSGLPLLAPLPTTRPRLESGDETGNRIWFDFDPELASAIKRLARSRRCTVFMVLLAALQIIIFRHTGEADIVIGTATSNRDRAELEPVVGTFANYIVIRQSVAAEASFSDHLVAARAQVIAAADRQDVPYELLVAKLSPERRLGHNPLFQTVISLHEAPIFTRRGLGQLSVELGKNQAYTARLDLMLETSGWKEETPAAYFEYRESLFSRIDIERLRDQLRCLLYAIVDDPEMPVAELPLATPATVCSVLESLDNDRPTPGGGRVLHDLVEKRASERPDAPAIYQDEVSLTYAELVRGANGFAEHLRELGVRKGDRVGLYGNRGYRSITAMLAILKTGAAYVPLDPRYPKARLLRMCMDASVRIVVDLDGADSSLNSEGVCLVEYEPVTRDGFSGPSQSADDCAYVMYTSGTTGVPNGVAVSHGNVLQRVVDPDYVSLCPKDVVLHAAPLCFDASVFEIWGALVNGAALAVVSTCIPSVSELSSKLRRHRVSKAWLTASLFNLIVDEAPDALVGLEQLIIGGEALSVQHVRRALALADAPSIINGYGPTETTVFACAYPIPRQLELSDYTIPIGRPVAGTRVVVLDDRKRPVAPGIPGELAIAGGGLAQGYLMQSSSERTCFFDLEIPEGPVLSAYLTGDRVRINEHGDLEYLGRYDDQVKIRGHRIEPGEVRAILLEQPQVREAAVVVEEGSSGPRLHGFVVPVQNLTEPLEDLLAYLSNRLPASHVPAYITYLDSLPLTSSGKLDRSALPKLPGLAQSASTDSDLSRPVNRTETLLLEIWNRVLERDDFGVEENFFELGGHSVLAMVVMARINDDLAVEMPISVLFEAPTVRELAKRLQGNNAETTQGA